MADPVPHDIRVLADERARARRARDWATADRLKGNLEAAGWRVVDAASLYSLERMAPAAIEVDGELRYGSSLGVPSRLDEPPTVGATVVIVASDAAGLLLRAVAALRDWSPRAQIVVVANAPSDEVAAEVKALPEGVEIVRLAARLGAAASRNAGIRRASGEVVVLLDPRVEQAEDVVGTLVGALQDPTVAVAGIAGLTTTDLVHFEPAQAGAEPESVDLQAMAFRRTDAIARGPLDEHFTLEAYLDAWWSLVLRDVPQDAPADARPRRAVVVPGAHAAGGEAPPPGEERLVKKHRYRFLKWFAARSDLLVGEAGQGNDPD